MTLAISDYPRKQLGKVAEINGLTTADGPWIAVREAFDITGVKSGVLVRWEEEGMISVVQDSERGPRWYLKPELEVVAKVGPTLRTLRRYVKGRAGGDGANGPLTNRAAIDTRQEDLSEPDSSEGAGFVTTLANMLRGQKFTVEMVGERRVRVTRGTGSRGVEIECRRRASDGDHWWFSWGGSIWLCESDNPTEAVVQVEVLLRRMGAAR